MDYNQPFINMNYLCWNPSLGLASKARGVTRLRANKGDPGVISHAPGSAKSVRA